MTMTNTMHKTVYATQATKVKGQKLYAVTCYDTEDHAKLGTFTFNAKAKAEAWRAWFLTFEVLSKAQPTQQAIFDAIGKAIKYPCALKDPYV